MIIKSLKQKTHLKLGVCGMTFSEQIVNVERNYKVTGLNAYKHSSGSSFAKCVM